jgi:hypothetical protein
MAHDNVGEGEVGGGTVRQVADDQTVGDAAVLVHHEEVRHVVSATRVHQLAELVAAAVQPLRARKDEAHLLKKFFFFISVPDPIIQ